MNREEQILSLEKYVHNAAWHFVAISRQRTLLIDDLVAAGWVGAIKAVDSFDPSLGNKLETFARFRIEGAILDYLRKIDHLSRWVRRDFKAGLIDEEWCHAPVSIDREDGTPRPVTCIRAERQTEASEAAIDLENLFRRAQIPARTRQAIIRNHLKGERMHDIARSMGINQSRVSQICARGLRAMRAAA